MQTMSRGIFLCAIVLAVCHAVGQSAPSATDAMAALIRQQFGPTFSLPAGFPTPMITADFDGDGIEDVAIVADSKEPIPDSYNFKYRVMDPYNGYFGMGNPSITLAFSAPDPRRNHFLLVIFGSGQQAWHAPTPKAKFVLVNVPFDTITVGRMLVKKKKPPINIIKAEEKEVMDAAVYWDGKKWKWEPGNLGN